MRRYSNAPLQSQTSEPVIVVEDSFEDVEEETPGGDRPRRPDTRQSSHDDDSPTRLNPYLLCPYGAREVRKHSLPTPQCSGITASQVRRLSERGGDSAGPGPRQAEFLATLSTAPAPGGSGGRRHSVVTISKVPSGPMFGGRGDRRESAGAFPSGFPGRLLPHRRESIACPPVSAEPRGSVHNLQLDIMDDIVQARKVRMKLWNTSSERVCEVQPLGEQGTSGGVQRYSAAPGSGRRYSDFVGTSLAPIPSSSRRRASELPPSPASKQPPPVPPGIVCSNTDLISILSVSTSDVRSADQCEGGRVRHQLKSHRSNSFDVSVLSSAVRAEDEREAEEPAGVVWDGGRTVVDAHALGSAIEGFLRQTSPDTPPSASPVRAAAAKGGANKSGWFSGKGAGGGDGEQASETCDSSICSTLKDLFVK